MICRTSRIVLGRSNNFEKTKVNTLKQLVGESHFTRKVLTLLETDHPLDHSLPPGTSEMGNILPHFWCLQDTGRGRNWVWGEDCERHSSGNQMMSVSAHSDFHSQANWDSAPREGIWSPNNSADPVHATPPLHISPSKAPSQRWQ